MTKYAFEKLINKPVPPVKEEVPLNIPEIGEIVEGMRVAKWMAREYNTMKNVTRYSSICALGMVANLWEPQIRADRERLKSWLMTGRGTMVRRVDDWLFGAEFGFDDYQHALYHADRLADKMYMAVHKLTDIHNPWLIAAERQDLENARSVLFLVAEQREGEFKKWYEWYTDVLSHIDSLYHKDPDFWREKLDRRTESLRGPYVNHSKFRAMRISCIDQWWVPNNPTPATSQRSK